MYFYFYFEMLHILIVQTLNTCINLHSMLSIQNRTKTEILIIKNSLKYFVLIYRGYRKSISIHVSVRYNTVLSRFGMFSIQGAGQLVTSPMLEIFLI